MPGLLAVFEKELADHLGSRRYSILFTLICLAGLSATYVAGQSIREAVGTGEDPEFVFLLLFTASTGVLPPFVSFVTFLGPLAGLALGFDAINSERASGTMSRVLSQPVHRDSFINGKFLAGLTTVALMLACIMLILGGLGLLMIGIPPTGEEIVRLIAYYLISVVYVAFWMALAILFSTVFHQGATSALAGIAIWILVAFFMPMIAGVVANAAYPLNEYSDVSVAVNNQNLQQAVSRISPSQLYLEASELTLSPNSRWTTGTPILVSQVIGMVKAPLPVGQSLLLVWPQITGLIGLTVICFAIAYTSFMGEEIRA